MRKLSQILVFSLIVFGQSITNVYCTDFDFDKWDDMIINIRLEAQEQHISDKTINTLLDNSAFIPTVIMRDRNQSEFKLKFEDYKNKLITENRILQGKLMKKKYWKTLSRAEKKFGIPKQYILAFWGLESNYGEYKSKYNIANSFLSLIYEGRRESFFKKQLYALMKSVDNSKLNLSQIKGSWAGAMGHFQFIPTTMEMYAIDGNGDGKIDIINNIPDAIFSAANYLNKLGWNKNYKVLDQVIVPNNFDISSSDNKKTLSEWGLLGFTDLNHNQLPSSQIYATLIIPDNDINNAFLVYDNFYKIKKWNNSTNYAIVIGLLAEKLK